MTHLRFALRASALLAFIFAVSSASHAQATRTWVSGVGDDANPCSRTAPCKTFAGAISKTFINGEIDALDPGGFGTLTITKSITIDGGSAFASVLASGTNGFNINIAAGNGNDPLRRATLRRLSINGTGASGTVGTNTGLRGISISAANQVFVENCYIQNFSQEGINTGALAESGTYLSVKDTNITNCATGINVTTTAAGASSFIQAAFERVRIEKCTSNGVTIGTHGHAYVRNSFIIFNGGDGIGMSGAVTDGGVQVESTFIGSNSVGMRNGGTGSTIDMSNTSIMANGTGLATASGAAGGGINSHGNNQIAANGTPGTTPNPVGQQ
jgi:hypothetical protein